MGRRSRALALAGTVSALLMGAGAATVASPRLAAARTAPDGTGNNAAPTPRRASPNGTMTGPFDVAGFACTGAPQSHVVPADVRSVTVRLSGGDGGDTATSVGGLGDFASAAVPVNPGESLTVDVGCVGQAPNATTGGVGGWGPGAGGGGGEGPSGQAGAGGGGGSAVLRAGTPLVAAGGGGGGAAGPGGSGL